MNTTNTFLKVDERLFELLKQDFNFQDLCLLSVLLRKSELQNRNSFFISYAEFTKTFNLSPYQVRTSMKKLSRWVKVEQVRHIGLNKYTLDKKTLEEDLQQLNNDACNTFYFDRMKVEGTDIEISEVKALGERREEASKVTVTFFNKQKNEPSQPDKFFSSDEDKKSRWYYYFQNIKNQIKKFYGYFQESLHNLITENTELKQNKKIKNKKINGNEIQKIQKIPNLENQREILEDKKLEVSLESNSYLTTINDNSSGEKRKRGRPPKNYRSSSGGSGAEVCSAETSDTLPTLGGLGADEFRRLLVNYWSRQPSEEIAFEAISNRLAQTTLPSSVQEIIKAFVWWFPADLTLTNPKKFYTEWFEPCLQFALNPIPFQFFSTKFLSQWDDVVNPPEHGKHYSMLTPKGSWAFMRKSIANYLQRKKVMEFDVYLTSPLPTSLEEFKFYCRKQKSAPNLA